MARYCNLENSNSYWCGISNRDCISYILEDCRWWNSLWKALHQWALSIFASLFLFSFLVTCCNRFNLFQFSRIGEFLYSMHKQATTDFNENLNDRNPEAPRDITSRPHLLPFDNHSALFYMMLHCRLKLDAPARRKQTPLSPAMRRYRRGSHTWRACGCPGWCPWVIRRCTACQAMQSWQSDCHRRTGTRGTCHHRKHGIDAGMRESSAVYEVN